MTKFIVTVVGLLLGTATVVAENTSEEKANYSPYAGQSIPREVYWGDTHVHTNMSLDAITSGNLLSPEVSYQFAKGEEVTTNTGQRVKLSRPLDFLVVTDHSEYLGVVSDLVNGRPPRNELERRWLQFAQDNKFSEIMREFMGVMGGDDEWSPSKEEKKNAWHQVIENAERHNDPGQFTAFIGYEWTSSKGTIHLHRNVIFRDGAEKAKLTVPFTSLDSTNAQDLWNYLEGYEQRTGGGVLAIPHNPNLSEGEAFPLPRLQKQIVNSKYARNRARWEPLLEVTQSKGDAETHPLLNPNDSFADFERMSNPGGEPMSPEAKKRQHQSEYARSMLKQGLVAESLVGTNPYRMGLIGSTDTHISISTAEENNYIGSISIAEPSADRMKKGMHGFTTASFSASGYAAVWAHENTRESIFDAMKRREVYATTGPRILLRMFGGWQFDNSDVLRPDLAVVGYQKGVPMGGSLSNAPASVAPGFIITAAKDPIGANLDRIQIIKGWMDSSGDTHEKIYDVALSDGREIDPDTGTVPTVGSTVDVESASYTNAIGDSQLLTFWQDPDFDPSESAFYYARVLEIPTPRWTTYDAVRYKQELPEHIPPAIQERAYGSPVWYRPSLKAGER